MNHIHMHYRSSRLRCILPRVFATPLLLVLLAGCGGKEATTEPPVDPPGGQGTRLAFVAAPGRAEGQVAFTPALEVEARDVFGRRITTFNGSVTIALKNNPGQATLGGTLTRPAANGVVRFDDLTLDNPGTGYTLRAVSGTVAVESAPFDVGLTMATVSAGGDYTCGVTKAGKGYCWGRNYDGELGNGLAMLSSPTPVAIPGGYTFAMLSAGSHHACALTTAGKVYCWGAGVDGQLGNGGAASSKVLVAVSGTLSFKSVSAAFRHSCGVTTTGQAHCWGRGDDGQLGAGSTRLQSNVPVAVSGSLTFDSLSAGDYHTCGVTTAGKAYCWGQGFDGQRGDGTQAKIYTPASIAGNLTLASVSAGGLHSCGAKAGSPTYCWGFGGNGALGYGGADRQLSPVPVDATPPGGAVKLNASFAQVSASGTHTCGVTSAGKGYCWGTGDNGRLGNGASASIGVPVAVSGNLTFASVSAGATHSCAVTPTGEAYCWGSGYTGELGNGGDTASSTPVLVFGTKH